MSSIAELKKSNLQAGKGNMINESDYVLRKKTDADLGVNTIVMEDYSKYVDDIAKAKAELLKDLGVDERAKMKAELMAEIRAELKAEAKGTK